MFCTTGVIGKITDHGIALPLKESEEAEYFGDTYCEVEVENWNAFRFKRDCKG